MDDATDDEGMVTRDQLEPAWLVEAVFENEVSPYDDPSVETDTPARLEITFSVGEVAVQASEAFAPCDMLIDHELEANGEDLFREQVVVRFDELVAGHCVFVTGIHASGEYNDDDYAASFSGSIIVVPAPDADAAQEVIVSDGETTIANGLASMLGKIERQLRDLSDDAVRKADISGAASRIIRDLATRP